MNEENKKDIIETTILLQGLGEPGFATAKAIIEALAMRDACDRKESEKELQEV